MYRVTLTLHMSAVLVLRVAIHWCLRATDLTFKRPMITIANTRTEEPL